MNRRLFLTRGLSTAACATMILSLPTSAFITGCAVDPKELLNAVINSAQGLLRVAGSEAWAPQLSTALSTLVASEASWAKGGTITVVDDALNTIMSILAAVPITAPYSSLVDIVIAGIEGILAVIPQNNNIVNARSNVHVGRVRLKKPRFYQNTVSVYRKQFNDEAERLGLTAAKF